jgi:hypothetical protein
MAALLACIPFCALAQDGATVQGTVTNSATHAGLSGVAVTLWTQQAVHYNATTDENGAWRISGMQPGRYYSRFEKLGFVEPPRESPLLERPMAVGAGGTPIQLDRELVPLATVSGHVLDPDGKPAAGVEVGFSMYDTVTTDSNGEFVLRDERPGSYWLLAKLKSRAAATEQEQRTETVPTYYPSEIDRAQATPIAVHAGDELSGFEIRLRASPVFRLRGVVLDESGNPLPNATVHLLGRSKENGLAGQMTFGPGGVRYFFSAPGLEWDEAEVTSGREGAFEFSSVRPGEWLVRAETEPRRGAARDVSIASSDTQPAVVTDRDIEQPLQLHFRQTFTLAVGIDWQGAPPPAANTLASLPLLLIPDDAPGPVMPRILLKKGETLRIENVAEGRYRILPMPGFPSGYYPAAVLVNGQDVLGRAADLNAATPPLRLVYKPNAATIRGIVEKGEGATVLLWQQSPALPDLVRAVQAGPNGTFEIGSVPPGDYDVLAVDRQNLEKQPEPVLRGFPARATPVHVDESSSATVSLSLLHLSE